ncbi:MAG: group 1 truncated hemoglobin [Candidatus Rokubacteria bacterium]|nr:group 1 truncated hemoglobin [Candidatus Rokubacteria bacterium]
MRLMSRAVLMAVVAVTFAACASAPPGPTLYQRLGGREAIKGVVDDFVANVVADPRVNSRFKGLQPAAVAKLQTNLADQICDATGGPCAYLGRDMKATHAGMRITDAEWSATVEDLVKSLNKFKVGAKEQQELLAILGPMKKDIVGQ